jgi:hypothetical protein
MVFSPSSPRRSYCLHHHLRLVSCEASFCADVEIIMTPISTVVSNVSWCAWSGSISIAYKVFEERLLWNTKKKNLRELVWIVKGIGKMMTCGR